MYKKYQHVERIGRPEVDGILDGMCYVFPKLDGTNAHVWWDDGIKAGSRKRELSADSDNAGFYAYVKSRWEEFAGALQFISRETGVPVEDIHLYGEWLVPHTIRRYRKDAWREFYLFDVVVAGEYISYDAYELCGLECIPPLAVVDKPTVDELLEIANKNTYIMSEGVGEGVVIKRYDFANRFGGVKWAKLVLQSFNNQKSKKRAVPSAGGLERKIARYYMTDDVLGKELAKLGDFEDKLIPRFLETCYHVVVTEDIWDALKRFKVNTLSFKTLRYEVNDVCKSFLREEGLL